MAKPRDTSRYELYDGNKKVYIGVTNDLERRTEEHKADGLRFSRVQKMGPDVTRDSALAWERQALESYQRSHDGKPPRGNSR